MKISHFYWWVTISKIAFVYQSFDIPILVIFNLKFNFMARNTSILLGEHYDEFISKEVSSGKYNSASEVIRSALRMLEEEEEKKKIAG